MEKINKVLRVKGQHGHNVNVLREQYLREDIPCGSPRCLAGCKNNTGNPLLNQLSDTAAHYVVPDIGVICDYLEVLELPELTSIVITQTVMHHVKHESGSRHYNRVQSLVRNPQKFSVVFHNEFQRYAYCSRKPGESKSDWQNRSVYEAALWYHNHLVQRTPIVMLTEHQQVIAEYGNKTIGLFVMSVSEYLESFWNHLEGAYQLYESLSASLAVTKSREEYSVHLPVSELNTGVQTGRFVQGRLNVNKHNAQQEAFLSPSGTTTKAEESDILIYGLVDRQRAVHGDTVVVELLPTASWKSRSKALHDKTESSGNPETDADSSSTVMPTGRVVGIIKRNWRVYVASLPQEDSTAGSRKSANILIIPWDRRIPKIRIGTSQAATLKYDRILVRIDGWEMDSQYPHGHFVKSLGRAGDLETEIATILHENELSACPFAEKQISELPVNNSEHPWQMTFDDIKNRRDLRYSHLVFSIDPKGCEDVDDTLSIRKLPDKNLELGVHIADVTHFVPAGSLTDLEAQSRSTTVYLADRRHDMIPTILSADLCSLLSEVDRFAVSVIWTLNPDTYEVLDVWYGRTVIRSAYKLFYEMAQEISEGTSVENMVENIPELRAYRGNELNEKVSELRWCISELMSFARHTQATRTQGGAVQLEGVEVQVQINKDKDIQDLLPKQPLEVHETIAECMIFANHWVAKKIYQTYPTHSVLRQHPLPRQTHFTELRRCAGSCGFQIDTDSNKTLAESLDACVVANDPVVNKVWGTVLRSLATQAMSQAEYLSTGSAQTFSHYGLALEYYTHFTSPIRRYADILVHRLLLASVGESTETLSLIQGKQLEEIAQHMNSKHRASQSAQKQSLELFQCLYFTSHVDNNSVCLADAVICQLRPNGVLVFVPRYGIKGAVYLRHRDGLVAYRDRSGADTEWCSGTITVRDHYLTVDSVYGEQLYTLFDHITVRVHIETTHAHGSQIKLHLVDNQPYIPHIEETPTTHSKHQLIQDVHDNADTIVQERDELRLGPNYKHYKSLYGQTTDPTFYTMLTRLKEHSLTYDGEP